MNSLPRKYTAIPELVPSSETLVIYTSVRSFIQKYCLKTVALPDLSLSAQTQNFWNLAFFRCQMDFGLYWHLELGFSLSFQNAAEECDIIYSLSIHN